MLIGLCLGVLAIMESSRRGRDVSTPGLLRRLPNQNDGVQFYVDIQTLRRAGLLDTLLGSRASEELDYRRFVEAVQFDYREDLDTVVGVFAGKRSNFILKGRMNWPAIRGYAQQHGAECRAGYCSIQGRTPDRILSFYPIYTDVLSLSIHRDRWGAKSTTTERQQLPGFWIPQQPFWVALPAAVLRDPGDLPPGAAAFASQLKHANRVTLAVGASGADFQAEMRARFADSAAAAESRASLEKSTETLQSFLSRAKQKPGPGEFAAILVSGKFTAENYDVIGRWPVSRDFLDALSRGSL